jgi:polar amino acid transport system substrate-binding protein
VSSSYKWPLVSGIAVLAAFLGAALFGLTGADESLQRARQDDLLRVGFAVEAPFAFVGPDSQVQGVMPELARELAGRLGIRRVEFIQTSFLSLIPDLLERRFDVIACGFYISPERQRIMRFSRPVSHSGPALMVRKGNPLNLPAFPDLKPTPALRVAIMDRTGSERRMLDSGYSHDNLLLVPDPPAGAASVISGEAQGLVMPVAQLRILAQGRPQELDVLDGKPRNPDWRWGEVAFAFNLSDRSLQSAWDEALGKYQASQAFRELAFRHALTEQDLIVQ